MTRIYRLEPIIVHDRSLTFAWNRKAGTFTGPDGAYVAELCKRYARMGTVVTDPYPTTYDCTDPRHNPAHLAAILSTWWRLPDELAEHLPRPPEHGRGEVEVVY